MKLILCLFAVVAVAVAFPQQQQREGQAFSNEAIRQAQQSFLIPRDAQIQNVREAIELAAYEQIPGKQRVNLHEVLGDEVPPEVIRNLQSTIDQIGRD